MVNSIPADEIVTVSPGVLNGGGRAMDLNGLILTNSPRVPMGNTLGFASQFDVATFFGPTSQEAQLAGNYFLGYDNSTVKPGYLMFWQYNVAPVAAYVRGGDVSAIGLTALQAINGSLAIIIDGVTKTAVALNLTGVGSFSAAAALIATGLTLAGPTQGIVTGSISGTTLTVATVTSGAIAFNNQPIAGTGSLPGTIVTGQLTGTAGGVGTYSISPTQTVASTTLTSTLSPVFFDSQTGSFNILSGTTGSGSTISYVTGTAAGALGLTAAMGAVLSQGAIASTPAAAMDAVLANSQNWSSFMTTWLPSQSDMLAFALWNNLQGNSYIYAMWDSDIATTMQNDTTSVSYQVMLANYSGIACIYDPVNGPTLAAFTLSYAGCLDFPRFNGRATLAFRSQTGIPAGVTNRGIARVLKSKGVNFYGSYATANDVFTFFQTGAISGPFRWVDSYANQIWMNNEFQLAIITGLVSIGSIPYNQDGRTYLKAVMSDPIIAAKNFGAIRAGVQLSNAQAVAVNAAAGVKIDDTLYQVGWYLQILDPPAQIRVARGSPVCTFWYTDGQSVQSIKLASIEIQ